MTQNKYCGKKRSRIGGDEANENSQIQLMVRDSHSQALSESDLESTTYLFSGKKGKRNLKSAERRQRYLKSNMGSHLNFDNAQTVEKQKSKVKQYWTEEEVSNFSLYFTLFLLNILCIHFKFEMKHKTFKFLHTLYITINSFIH